MPLNPFAFGPLSRGQAQAARRVAGGQPRPVRLQDLGQPDEGVATTAAPLERVPESFQPLFPELAEAEQPSVTDLPGAGQAAPDFGSPTAQRLIESHAAHLRLLDRTARH